MDVVFGKRFYLGYRNYRPASDALAAEIGSCPRKVWRAVLEKYDEIKFSALCQVAHHRSIIDAVLYSYGLSAKAFFAKYRRIIHESCPAAMPRFDEVCRSVVEQVPGATSDQIWDALKITVRMPAHTEIWSEVFRQFANNPPDPPDPTENYDETPF